MATIASPLHFIPFLRPMVWGGRRLAAELGKTLPTDESYGESWEISDHAVHTSVVASGPLAGWPLRRLMQQHGRDILGRDAAAEGRFPWLIKYLDACDWLSVQVHPNDEQARRLRPGECGKTEAWFVLSAQPGSRVYAGLRPGVGPDDFRQALKQGDVVDLLHSFTPRAGDCLFLPAGTVHAVGGGVLLAEIQQDSDVTFRLFDWNRKDAQDRARPLHVEEGLACIDWQRGPVDPIHVPEIGDPSAADETKTLVRCPYFDLDIDRRQGPFTVGGMERLQSMIVLGGQADFAGETLGPGQVWLLPASLPRTTVAPRPTLTYLMCSLPAAELQQGEPQP